jgi:carboxypeptidase Taq
MKSQYDAFLKLITELHDIGHAQGLLSWDQETNMPAKGAAQRARSLGALAGISHERLTSPRLVELVGELSESSLSGDAAVNVREIKRSQDRALKIPRELVVELSETTSLGHEAWVEAREKSQFDLFAPWLTKILELQKRAAHLIGFEGSIYNAFLDEYEPYATTEEVGPLLKELNHRLVPLVQKILDTGTRPAEGVLDQVYPAEQQEAFGRQVLSDLGFNTEAGRLDVSVHPFCSGLGLGDVRLTTRYNESYLSDSLFGIIHECGHGLYEQGLPADADGTPVARSVSLGIHESQSRMWENMIGRSRGFWEHYLPQLQQRFPKQLSRVDVDEFYAAVNQVSASFIRVEADEITYNLHILLRFELEKALVEDDLAVSDLPEAWNEGMRRSLGIDPPTAAQGVLQDVHWSFGLIGYFPTYTLGNLYAAQFLHQARQEIADLDERVRSGDFASLLSWLRTNIHSSGSRLTATELVKQVTGEPLTSEYLMEYLESKYCGLYGV